jgi:hypothetical protein
MALTGRYDFRKTWLGNLTLVVEEEVTVLFRRKPKQRWRRASLVDLASIELRPLIDNRFRAHNAGLLGPRPASLASANVEQPDQRAKRPARDKVGEAFVTH